MAQLSTLARFTTSGEILSEDTLALLTHPKCDVPGAAMDDQTARKAKFDESEFLVAYELLSDLWQSIRHEAARYDTSKFREKWQREVVEMLGHQIKHYRHHTLADGRTVPINYRTEQLPLWLEIYGADFDQKPEGRGRNRRSAHDLFQAYLDATEADAWGILFNGRRLRLLHDYHKSLTRNYVEADLESIFDALDVDAFRAVWRIFHASRFLASGKGVRPIEMLRDESRQQGASVGKELRFQVRDAIQVLGNGFIAADRTGTMRVTLTGNPGACHHFYRSLLLIVYRLLFLLYIENRRGWTPVANPIWADSYSISRLRERAEAGDLTRDNGKDDWEGLKVVFRLIRDGSEFFDIHPYGGELFDDERLGLLCEAALRNADLLQAIRLLTLFERQKQVHRVNFTYLDLEALGSVYEGMLEVTITVEPDGSLHFIPGADRKLLGTHFTPPQLIDELIESALNPVIEERLQGFKSKEEREKALLSIKAVDPTCGSGTFLIAACDALAAKLVEIRLEGEEPSDLDVREARRDVVRQCIHGVDVKDLAVDLCRFKLWLHVAHPNFPLSYLEPLIKCGNSLIGVPLPLQVETARAKVNEERARLLAENNRRAAAKILFTGWPDTIPDGAFDAIGDDDKNAARDAKKSNNEQRGGQLSLDAATGDSDDATGAQRAAFYAKLRAASDKTKTDVDATMVSYHEYLESEKYKPDKRRADLWCAAFYQLFNGSPPTLTHQWLMLAKDAPKQVTDVVWAEVARLAEQVKFFHWQLEFPDVFKAGGFDCVLGNPPWERIKLQEQEFFAGKDNAIVEAPNKAARQRLIDALPDTNVDLAKDFANAKHAAEADSRFCRNSGRFPLTAVGDMNTYALFAETFRALIGPNGRAGFVCPTGIATDDTTKDFFAALNSTSAVLSLLDFENREKIFQDVDSRYKFCLLTLSGAPVKESTFAFFLTNTRHLSDLNRVFKLTSEDIQLLNPNTRTCPVFRTRADAELTKAIYKRVPVLLDEETEMNPWAVRFSTMFHMSNDSGLFESELSNCHLPLYEAKMMHQFDHRFATHQGDETRDCTVEEKHDPSFTMSPRYWVNEIEVLLRTSQALPALIQAYRSGNEQTMKQVLLVWLAGYHLNRGNDEVGSKLLLQAQSAPDAPRSATLNWLALKSWEEKWPLTEMDVQFILDHFDHPLEVATDFVRRQAPRWLLSFRDIARTTDVRTAIFCLLPLAGVGNNAPICLFKDSSAPYISCLLANANALVFDFVVRHKAGGTHLNFFIVKQLPILPPHAYSPDAMAFIAPRVLELVYTAHDMAPFARDMGYDGPPFLWDEERRAVLRAELDAYFARLYGLTRKQLRYILDPQSLSDRELRDLLDPQEEPTCSGPHMLPKHPTKIFPGETFRVLKKNEIDKFGEYRTRRLVLEAWARLEDEHGPAPVINYREHLMVMSTPAASVERPAVTVESRSSGKTEVAHPRLAGFD